MLTSRRAFIALSGGLAFAAKVANANGIRYGYTAMTWGKNERQAIEDIESAGYPGIQFRIDAVTEFKAEELRALLREHKLTFVALSSGEVLTDADVEAAQIANHIANAKYFYQAGGLYLQVLDQMKALPRVVTADECKRLGKLLTEIGKRTADEGVPLVYHNHMNTMSEHPENLDRVLEASDSKYVKLLLDTAHSVAGGGDAAVAIRKYAGRLTLLHLKDVVDAPMAAEGPKYPFKFVELGRGRVDLPAVFAALLKVHFKGWAVVELDRVPDSSATPKQAALTSRKYLEDKIGAKVTA